MVQLCIVALHVSIEESLCGKVYSKDYRAEWETEAKKNTDKTSNELEEASKVLANCSYEKDTHWGEKVSPPVSFSLLLLT
jgi:hypothetical protein